MLGKSVSGYHFPVSWIDIGPVMLEDVILHFTDTADADRYDFSSSTAIINVLELQKDHSNIPTHSSLHLPTRGDVQPASIFGSETTEI